MPFLEGFNAYTPTGQDGRLASKELLEWMDSILAAVGGVGEDTVGRNDELIGVSNDDVNLGTFDGDIISDNATVRGALQELETAIEDINPYDTVSYVFVEETDQTFFYASWVRLDGLGWKANRYSPATVTTDTITGSTTQPRLLSEFQGLSWP